MATIDLGKIRFNWQGAYNNSTAYVQNDCVSSSGNSYICKLASTGNAVSNGTYWDLMSSAGTNGTDLTSTLSAQGDVLYRDGSGLQRLAKPASDQFLKNTSGGVVSWADAGGGSLTLISSVTASNSASVNFTSGITSTYDTYVVYGEGIVPAEDDREMGMRTSTDGGSSFDSSSGNYNWILNEYQTASLAGGDSASDTSGKMCAAGIGNASGESFNFKAYIHAPSNASLQTLIDGESVFMRATGVLRHNRFSIRRISAADVDAIQFIMSSGNITSGRFSLFGIAHS